MEKHKLFFLLEQITGKLFTMEYYPEANLFYDFRMVNNFIFWVRQIQTFSIT